MEATHSYIILHKNVVSLNQSIKSVSNSVEGIIHGIL